ncbi:MAG: serine/threonine-protein kinase, partial [Myxococcaceae bacterium]
MATIEVGTVVADAYEVTGLLGRGGMGEVWAAKHRRLPGKQVAIKVLHLSGPRLSAETLSRFRREAEIATRIGHPNIVEVHDFNTLADGTPYLVLELLQGESLAARLRFPIELEEVQLILRQVGSALQAAHSQGVVHRDLKPDNIFLVPEERGALVKVLDFGISKILDSATVQTQDSVLIGTPAYMSPEQALGANKEVGPQSDVFSLGAIAYEMLAGKPPFSAPSIAQLVFRIAYEPHSPLEKETKELPPAILAAVEHALVKDRSSRTPDVETFVAELTGDPLPPLAPRPDLAGRVEPTVRASPGDSESQLMGETAAPAALETPRARAVRPSAPRIAPQPAASPGKRVRLGMAVLAAIAGTLGGVVYLAIPQEQPWLERYRKDCSPYRVDQLLEQFPPKSSTDRVTCLLLAGKVAAARSLLVPMPRLQRWNVADAVFTVIDPNDTKATNEAAQPVMALLVELVPDHDRALFQLAIAEYGHDNEAAIRHMEESMRVYSL